MKARTRTASHLAEAALGVTVLLASAPALANEADSYGLGSRSTAMGGAVSADVTDFSANYYNPAGLVGARGVELSIGYLHAYNHLSIDGKSNHVSDAHGIVGGIVAPGTFFKIPFAFGIGTYMPDSGLSRVDALTQQTPRWALYDERASILFLAANLAVRPVSWLEIGGGAAFLAATQGSFQVTGTANVQQPYDSDLRHAVDADLTAIRYPQLGARVKVGSLGYASLVYRGQTKLELSIAAALDGQISFAGIDIPLVYDLSSRTIDAFLPQQVVLGMSFQKANPLHVNFDLTFVNWAAYESPTARSAANLKLTLPPGLAITLPPQPKATVVLPPDFKNRLVPRLGVEYFVPAAGPFRHVAGTSELHRALEIPLRAGYVYEASPVPPQTGLTNFVDANRHTASIGTGAVVNAPSSWMLGSIALDLHAQLSELPERTTIKADAADFVGSYRASGWMLGLGSTLTGTF